MVCAKNINEIKKKSQVYKIKKSESMVQKMVVNLCQLN